VDVRAVRRAYAPDISYLLEKRPFEAKDSKRMIPEKQMDILLRPAPRSVENSAGHPAFGTYQGTLNEVDLGRLAGPYHLTAPMRLLKEKKWQYQIVCTPELIALFAIVDLSYTANAFVMAIDRRDKRVLVDKSFLGVPGPLARVGNCPGEGLSAHFQTLGASFSVARAAGRERYRLAVDVWDLPMPRKAVHWRGDILAVGGAPALSVIAPVADDGVVNVTQKWAGLLAFGNLTAGGRTYVLDGGVAGLDYTHGFLARHTAWRWALAVGRLGDGTPVGVNLVEGFNDESEETNENALWVGRTLVPLGRAKFTYNKQDWLDPWHVRTLDGTVDLEFRPMHAHREERDYKLVRSRFVQPVGTFRGTLRIDGRSVPVELGGVTEDQDMLW
jgi:hypothetical protein